MVVSGGEPVGFVTSAAYGGSIRQSIASAWLPLEAAEQGSAVEVEYFARRYPATVAADPIFDPEMRRTRS